MGAAPEPSGADSAFRASSFDSILRPRILSRWIGWQRRMLAAVALLGCLGLYMLAYWLAATPYLNVSTSAGPAGELVVKRSANALIEAQRGRTLVSIGMAGRPPLKLDALLVYPSPRWQVDDALRRSQVAQHIGFAALLVEAAAADAGANVVQLRFDNGVQVEAAVAARGYDGIGWVFWPLSGLALLLVLFAAVLLVARPQLRNVPFVVMSLCQVGNLLFIALQSTPGLGLPGSLVAADMPVRTALDLCTGAAAVHAFALHPQRLARASVIAAAAWGTVLFWLLLANSGRIGAQWWWAQAGCVVLGLAALAVISYSQHLHPNPYAVVVRRFSVLAVATLVLATTAVAVAATAPVSAPGVAAGVSVAWYLFLASLLLLMPFLARSRQLLREFALLAGISTVATSLDLLFVAVFSLGPFASLAMAVFFALGVYAGARQWLLNHFIGGSMLTTERTFDKLYRAAREVQSRPARYTAMLGQLLRDLFEPLEVLRVDRVPVRSRVLGGGSMLVVPLRPADDEAPTPAAALVLRYAQGGRRLFTHDDARLADRVLDQLRRAVAYDQAVERGRFEERQRIAQDLHDDIGARLLTLMYQAPTPEMEDYIRHTLQDLKTLTRGLAAAEHRLSHAAAEWKTDLMQRLTVAHVVLDWYCIYDIDLRLSVVQWSALTRVLRELVSNSLYHGHATRVEVGLHFEGGRLRLHVADDGVGRNPRSWAHGLGLGGVRKRVKLLGGEVAWRENEPLGIVCDVHLADFTGRS